MEELISPNKALIHFDSESTAVLEVGKSRALWAKIKNEVKTALTSSAAAFTPFDSEDLAKYRKTLSCEFMFAEGMSPRLLLAGMGGNNVNDIQDICPVVEGILIYAGVGDPFFVIYGEKSCSKISFKNLNVDDLKSECASLKRADNLQYCFSMRDIWNADSDSWVSLEMTKRYPKVYYNGENAVKKDMQPLVEQLFGKQTDYIREITEKDNTTLLLYGQTVLKIHEDGTIEYIKQPESRVAQADPVKALSAAASFLHVMGLDGKLNMVSIKPTLSDGSHGYRINFAYNLGGVSALYAKGDVYPVWVEVLGSSVKTFTQVGNPDSFVLGDPSIIPDNRLSSYEVLDKNLSELLKEQKAYMKEYMGEGSDDVEIPLDDESLLYEMLKNISSVDIVYFDDGKLNDKDELPMAWQVHLGNRYLFFDSENGNLLCTKKE